MTSKITRTLVAAATVGGLLAVPAVATEAQAAPVASSVVAKSGSRGTTVKRIQTDLKTLGYLKASSVTGYYGATTAGAVRAFQKASGLSVTGVVDSRTDSALKHKAWAKLNAWRTQRAAQAAAAQRAANQVVAKPGDRNTTVRQIQGRLNGLGYLPASSVIGVYGPQTTAAVKAFQRNSGLSVTGVVNGRTNTLLIAKYKARSTSARPAVRLDPRCYVGRTICVDKSARRMYWVVNGQVKASYYVRVGRPSLPTREGTFKIYLKSVDWYSTLYHVHMPYTQFFSGGEAVHYSRDFAVNGYSGGGSHGCVNMNSRSDARWLYNQTRVGDRVVVYR